MTFSIKHAYIIGCFNSSVFIDNKAVPLFAFMQNNWTNSEVCT